MSEKSEVSAIIDDRLRRLQALSWEDLDSFPKQDELIVGESGHRYRVQMWTFWDMEPVAVRPLSRREGAAGARPTVDAGLLADERLVATERYEIRPGMTGYSIVIEEAAPL